MIIATALRAASFCWQVSHRRAERDDGKALSSVFRVASGSGGSIHGVALASWNIHVGRDDTILMVFHPSARGHFSAEPRMEWEVNNKISTRMRLYYLLGSWGSRVGGG